MESPPDAPKRVGPAPKYDWDAHKEMIVPLYGQKGYDEMATELKKIGFAPSRRAYLSKLKTWGVSKYVTSAKMKFMAEKAAKRNAENKDTVFTCEGKRVPTHKIKRFLRRQKNEREEDTEHNETYPEEAPTPEGIKWRSPSPEVARNTRLPSCSASKPLKNPLERDQVAADFQRGNEPFLNIPEPEAKSTHQEQQYESNEKSGGSRGLNLLQTHKRNSGLWKITSHEDTNVDRTLPNIHPGSASPRNPSCADMHTPRFGGSPNMKSNPWTQTADPYSMFNQFTGSDDSGWFGQPSWTLQQPQYQAQSIHEAMYQPQTNSRPAPLNASYPPSLDQARSDCFSAPGFAPAPLAASYSRSMSYRSISSYEDDLTSLYGALSLDSSGKERDGGKRTRI